MIKPLPHQTDAITAVIAALKKADRTHMVMACGTGKTLTSLWIAEKLAPKSIVIFVPSLALISQFMREWIKHTKWPQYEMLAVCSDNSVTRSVDEESILLDKIDFPVTNKPDKIKAFLHGPGARIVFCTYHSASFLSGLHIEFGIFDEAHKTAGYEKLLFGFGLIDSEIKIDKRLFMTATPRHGIPRTDKFGEKKELYSMDDESLYGKRCFELDFRKAINLGLICDYKVIISVIAKNSNHAFNKEFEIHEKAISLQKAIAESGAKKIITFHSSIMHAKAFANYLGANKMHPNIMHINSNVNIDTRSQMMKRFKHVTHAVMTNAKCLTEGVDVPTVDMVAFLNPKSSKIDIVQAIGRALRLAPGKERGYIFLPLLINDMDTMEQEIADSEFKVVWDILNALMEQDSDLADTVKYIGGTSGQHTPKEVMEDPFLKFLSFNNANLKQLIEVKILNKLVSEWDRMYAKLCEYKEQYGTAQTTRETDIELHEWCKRQRNIKKKLSRRHIELLNAIEFPWNENVAFTYTFDQSYDMLVAFKEEHGHLPSKVENKYLFNFIEWQKRKHKDGQLSEDRFHKLNNLGALVYRSLKVNKETDYFTETKWKEKFNQLAIYKSIHGDCRAPQRGPHASLGKWVCNQREDYRLGKLSIKRRQLLETLNFDFDLLDTLWHENFEKWKQYNCGENDFSETIQGWCTFQRKAKEKGKMSEERIKLLEEAAFKWEKRFSYKTTPINKHPKWDELLHHYQTTGGWSFGSSHSLCRIAKHIRSHKRTGQLNPESIKILDKLNFTWNPDKAMKQIKKGKG
jgi:predicted helicase